MGSTYSLFRGVYSANLAGNLLYFFVDRFFTLIYVTVREFLMNSFYNAWPVQILENHRLRSIQSMMKEMCAVLYHYVFLEFLWNYYFTVVRYKFYRVRVSAKGTLLIFFAFTFFQLGRGIPADTR